MKLQMQDLELTQSNTEVVLIMLKSRLRQEHGYLWPVGVAMRRLYEIHGDKCKRIASEAINKFQYQARFGS